MRKHIRGYERQIRNFFVNICIYSSGTLVESSLVYALEEFGQIKSIRAESFAEGVADSFYHIAFVNDESASRAIVGLNGRELNEHKLWVFMSPTCRKAAEAARSELSDVGCEAFVKLYLLADKLQDLTTANMVIDELVRFVAKTTEVPKQALTSLAYDSTVSSSPLRALLRDYWVYHMPTDGADHLKANDFPKDFLQDVATELMLLKLGKATTEDCKRDKCSDKCLYHQHDDEHPRCGAK